MDQRVKGSVLGLLSIFASSAAYYYSMDFHTIWWLMWFAPVPLLLYSRYCRLGSYLIVSFVIGALTYLFGIVGYWHMLLNDLYTLVFYLISGLQFAIVFGVTRYWLRNYTSWTTVFVFPILFSLSEWLLTFTPLATYSSISYNQLFFLPAVQIASIGGYIAVTFTVSLFASSLSYGILYYTKAKRSALTGMLIGFAVVALILAFGLFRIHNEKPQSTVKVGMVNITYPLRYSFNPKHSRDILNDYLPSFNKLVAAGAKFIFVPEEALFVDRHEQKGTQAWLSSYARQHHVYLVIGLREKLAKTYNVVWLFSPQGKLFATYYKRHLVPVIEAPYITPIKAITEFNYQQHKFAVAICRDMDYPKPAATYGKQKVNLLFVPAWDFKADAWVHGRLAFMRGVEYGYTVVRAARDGYLSVTTNTGRIVAKRYVDTRQAKSLIVNVPIATGGSFYAQHRYVSIILMVLMLLVIIYSRRK